MAVIIFGFNYRVISPERKNLREAGTYRIYESDAIRKILDMRDPSKTLSSSGRESVTAYLPHKKQTLFIRRPEVKHQENLPRPQEFVPLRTENTATVSAVAATMIQNQPLPEIRKSAIAVFDRNGIDLSAYEENGSFSIAKLRAGLKAAAPSNLARLKEEIIGMNIFNSVFVDCTASADVASLYEQLLSNNISVVAANKVAASSNYENYSRLKSIARKRGVKFLFETNVGAGLPIINTINDLINSGDKILKLEAVLSGTLNYIFNTISADIPFSETVRLAKEEGYAEPDPRVDLSGKDVIRKLVILSREAGYKMNQEDVQRTLFIPQSFFEGTLDEFWSNLPSVDAQFEAERQQLEAARQRWRFVAKLENGKGSVALQRVDERHPFYDLEGSNNIILITTERYNQYPMLIQGYGAGASVTAAGVFADIMSIANI